MTRIPSNLRGAFASPLRLLTMCGLMLYAVHSSAVLGPDFNGDGNADVAWHNGSTGESAIWFMSGAALAGGAGLMPNGTWVETHFADFNNDGRSDIVWRNTVTGETAMWLMNGGSIIGGAGLMTDPNWEITHTGDFNGDGRADIVWRHANGATALWIMNGTAIVSGASLLNSPNWRITHVADMDNDGNSDILWRNQSTGETVIWFMTGGAIKGAATLVTNNSLYVMHVADFNADGRKDVMLRNSANGQTIIWLLNNGTFVSGATILADPNWIATHVADFSGDGKADILWRNTVSGQTAIWIMNGTSFAGGDVIMNDPAWRPTHVVDLNGDGKGDIIWFNEDTGSTANWIMNGTSLIGGGGLLNNRWWQTTTVGDTSNPLGYLSTLAEREAMRFLTQTTMGPTEAGYQRARELHLDTWLYEQFIGPPSSHVSYLNSILTTARPLTLVDDFMERWWSDAVTAGDQFRQRATYALSQVLVLSTNDPVINNQPYAFAAYENILRNNVYGNYRQLLKEVTLSPAMGMYLNLLGSQRGNGTTTFPNENYARELLQLFSIGLFQMNDDGTYKVDANGQLIPTYDQAVIEGYAAALSGWAFGGATAGTTSALGACPAPLDPTVNAQFSTNPTNLGTRPECYYPFPMKGWQSRHEPASKMILSAPWVLNDTFVTTTLSNPVGATQVTLDLEAVLDSVFMHPNTPPFVCKALIQRLVTSNPTPGYVARCSAKFRDDGFGVRGSMKAVWRAILMDPEARTPGNVRDSQYGKAKEPVLRFTTLVRTLGGKSTSLRYRFSDFSNPQNSLGQSPYRAPTVFNFYDPDYVPEGGFQAAGKFAPELQILTTTTAVGGNNFINNLIYNGQNGVGGAAADRVMLDYSTLIPLATRPAVLIERLNFLLLGGKMSLPLRQQVNKAIEALPSATLANQTDRVKAAVYLMTMGPEFTVQK